MYRHTLENWKLFYFKLFPLLLPPNSPQVNPIEVTDNQTNFPDPNLINYENLTEGERARLLNQIDRMRNAARITREQYEYLRERLLPPLPTYEAPASSVNTPQNLNNPEYEQYFSETSASSTETSVSSTEAVAPTTPFNPVVNDNSSASASKKKIIFFSIRFY